MGLRKRAMISGVNLIHQGPWGIRLDAVQDARLAPSRDRRDTFTLSNSAATLAETATIRPIALGTRATGPRDSRSESNSYI